MTETIDSTSSWLRSAATIGQVIVGFLGLLTAMASFLLAFSERVTRIEERQVGVIARNAEQDRALLELRVRMENDEHLLNSLELELTKFRTQMEAEHKAIGEMIIRSFRQQK